MRLPRREPFFSPLIREAESRNVTGELVGAVFLSPRDQLLRAEYIFQYAFRIRMTSDPHDEPGK